MEVQVRLLELRPLVLVEQWVGAGLRPTLEQSSILAPKPPYQALQLTVEPALVLKDSKQLRAVPAWVVEQTLLERPLNLVLV
jgi:hypothetical protein